MIDKKDLPNFSQLPFFSSGLSDYDNPENRRLNGKFVLYEAWGDFPGYFVEKTRERAILSSLLAIRAMPLGAPFDPTRAGGRFHTRIFLVEPNTEENYPSLFD